MPTAMSSAAEGASPPTTPRLSVVVAMRDPWPAGRSCLDALAPQVAALGGEIVVAVSDRGVRPPPADGDRYAGVRWLERRGGSVFQLRAAALAQARGTIVAFTEDHARVLPGWCEAILAAHADHPDAAAVGGAVENVSRDSLIDWASFLVASGRFLPPLDGEASLQANVSYKRCALAGRGATGSLGLMQHTLHDELRAAGERLVADERMRVAHEQSLGIHGHSASHFHNGRSLAAFRNAGMSASRRALYAIASLALPAVLFWRTVSVGVRKGAPALRAAPWIAWLAICHACGELAGYVAGPGRSPERVN